jgi:predicted transcriptional regulator of viral defense system
MQLSKTENKVYETLKNAGFVLFTVKDICRLLSINETKAYNCIKALKKKRAIKKWGSAFSFSDADEFVIASLLHFPSYISLWSALQYYGLSDQMPKKIFLITTRYRKPIAHFIYVTVASQRYFGYTKIGTLTVAEKEKAIVDALFFPRYCGGIDEVYKCINNGWKDIDKKKLLSYARQMKSKVVMRRVTYIVNACGTK